LVLLPACVLAFALATAGCSSVPGPVIDTPPESLRSIYVVRRGWHTGIALPTTDWPNRNWTVLGDFPDSDYLEFGWGDERFYQAERSTVWQGSRAALWPTPSVLHVIGLREPIPETARARDVVEVRIPLGRLRTLATAIEREFAEVEPIPTGTTLRADPVPNEFYKGRQRFYFPRMCNWWTATRLLEAGCDIAPATVLFAARVIDESRACSVDYRAAVRESST
jgi:hypothetical protein